MNFSIIPDDVVKHIQSFVFIVSWQGCIPLDEYKRACTLDRLSTLNG